MTDASAPDAPRDFIREIVAEDQRTGTWNGRVVTRFPPEPNGYLHIGHAKSICLNFGIAEEFGGHCNLRFDDTNPAKESDEYVRSIEEDVRWLGFTWGERCFASDYFQQMYDWAEELIGKGLAYVDDQNLDEIRAARGTLTRPGTPSPHRERSVEENLDLFRRMRAGEFPSGSKVLRARIDMAAPNMNLRDPVMYRIQHQQHHNTGDQWCIYPMYDWAHGLEDSIEGVTHSICTLEFEDHRPLYDWFLEQLDDIHHPQQIEFARLNLTHTVLSKRKLLELVQGGHVRGWDDPRMPTLAGMRRRGFTPEAIRDFCRSIGVSKHNSTSEMALLEHCTRQHLNRIAPRFMAVLDPIKVVLTNFAEDHVEELPAVNNPEDPDAGQRVVPFSRELYIERDDFMEDPPKKFFRLAPGREVRLRYAFFITCEEVIKDDAGNIVELHCRYDPETRGGNAPDGRKVKATLHWVSARHAVDAEVREYNVLFSQQDPNDLPEGADWLQGLNPDSEKVRQACKLEPALAAAIRPGFRCQFERLGYFCVDHDSRTDAPIFNRTVTLKDQWAKARK